MRGDVPLVFMRALAAKGEDKALISLKGGCNLRFYFGSVRYSEAIDFDVVVIAKSTLKNKVERLLASPIVLAPLKAKGIQIAEVSAPKKAWLPDAIERAMSISFDDYRSKVVGYLAPEHVALYGSKAAWDAMQDQVVARLEALQ